MKIIDDDVWLCADCTIYAANGDTSGIDDPRRERAVTEGVNALGPHLAANFDSETGEGIEEFSRRTCAGCGSGLAGEFTRFAILGDETRPIRVRRVDASESATQRAARRGRVLPPSSHHRPPPLATILAERRARPHLDTFTKSMLETALWSTNDESTPQGGEPLDRNYTVADIELESLKKLVADAARFQKENAKDIAVLGDKRAGHDFWLTRNGHGAGFWDGDWPEPQATRLTKASKNFGEVNLYANSNKVSVL